MLRPTTNLIVPPEVQLDKKLMKSEFLYVYGKGYTGPEPVFINKLWLSTFMPSIAKSPSFGKSRKGIKAWAEHTAKNTLAGLLTLKKVNDPQDPHFVASVPLATFNRHDVTVAHNRFASWFTEGETDETRDDEVHSLNQELRNTSNPPDQISGRTVPGKVAVANMGIDARGKVELESTLLSLRLAYKGGLAVVFADFKINQGIAQQLTTTEWPMIRNIDLYPLLMQWVAGQFGYSIDTPLASFPVSKISKTLPKTPKGEARVNEDGLSIDPKGIPLWLPSELDNTSRYEDQFTQAGDRGDGTFSLLDMHTLGEMKDLTQVKTRLPANIPVLIDWVNKKFSYTQVSGILKVQDLSRFKAADAAHIHNLLTRWVLSTKQVSSIAVVAGTAGVEPVVKLLPTELDVINREDTITARKLSEGQVSLMEYWDLANSFATRFLTNNKPILVDEWALDGHEIFRPFARYVKLALPAVLNNLDAVNLKYSVSGVSTTLGLLTLLKYAGDQHIHLEASKLNSAAANQRVDPSWKPPSIPLARDEGMAFLPHQQKVRNLLKDSPDFAILPVQAGGGKSPLTISDVLYEIKADRNKPYLVLCPNSLVAQYVKEFNYFTGGKINVIPINSYMIMRNGFERLTKMMETAPRNTVVVCDYDVLRGKQRQVCYGTTSVTVYPVIEFLRQFKFDYAMLDESHSVKNDSQRTRACMVLIADIPKKRLASGTMAHDSPSDLAMQIAMLDPTLFGSKAEFNERFAEPGQVKGERVLKWRPGAQQEIMTAIKSRVVVAGAMRKEWAALLPKSNEQFLGVELTEAQHQVYQAILTEALDKMKEDAKNNKTLQKFFESQGVQVKKAIEEGEEEDEAEDAADENAGADLEALLGFYLARLEQYITAPARDDLGDRLLKGDDRISPKVKQIITQVKLHLDQKLPGKVLIFTNYTASAEEIFEQFPPELQKQGLLYVAAEKTETGAAFESDDRYRWMVGVENSMNTGLNFQHVSRLIRTETVWNPGTLEQGNSRVNRPELKKTEARAEIFYDWIVANRTLDITKISRLISKVIAVAKFENTDNLAYEQIEDVPVIAMNADSIQAMNDWEANLSTYANSYRTYKTVQAEDYAEYKAKHGNIKLEPVPKAESPKDAKLMVQLPYVPGLELHKAGELGLVRVDEYLRMDTLAGATEDEADEEAGEMTEKQKQRQKLAQALVGQPIHTEFGDGIIKSVSVRVKKVLVSLNEGGAVTCAMAASFIKTKPIKGEARNLLLKAVGNIPVDVAALPPSPIMKLDAAGERRRLKEKEAEEKKIAKKKAAVQEISIELYLNVSNGFLGLTYFVEEGTDDAKNVVQAHGFRPVPPHVLTQVKTGLTMRKWFDAMEAKKFTFDPKFREMRVPDSFAALYQMLKSGALSKGAANFNFSSKNNLINFFRQESKPSTDKNAFKPYPMVEDGKAYIVMHTRGQPANMRATKVPVPGIHWEQGADSMVYYGLDLAHTGQKIKELEASGVQIANRKELLKQFNMLKKAKLRKSEEV
jgi:hypothetical protein